MNRLPAPGLILALLLAVCFTLATRLQVRTLEWNKFRAQNDSLMAVTLGDAQRMFATYFFREADVYFHSGYYPSIFDQAHTNEMHIVEQANKEPGTPEEKEEAEDFLGPPRDWVEKFGRHFYITEHTHLPNSRVHEILPWLRVSADLDPHQVETYIVTAYWLREHMHQPHEAEAFLREGQRANPDSYEILYELGQVYFEDYKDVARARNLFELAWRKYSAYEARTGDVDLPVKRGILVCLMQVEKADGHFAKAADYMQTLYDALPAGQAGPRADVKAQIDELRRAAAAPPAQ
jgi:tetratricopeptide (TPR) repeat protein